MDPIGISTRSIRPSNWIWNFVAWIEGMPGRKLHRKRIAREGKEVENRGVPSGVIRVSKHPPQLRSTAVFHISLHMMIMIMICDL